MLICQSSQYHEISARFKISITTISRIKKGRPSHDDVVTPIVATPLESDAAAPKRTTNCELLSNRMLEWIAEAQKRNVRISSTMIQQRAKTVATAIGWTTFRASSGWCAKFLNRHDIKLRVLKRQAQAKSRCEEGTAWETRILNPQHSSSTSSSDASTTLPTSSAAVAASSSLSAFAHYASNGFNPAGVLDEDIVDDDDVDADVDDVSTGGRNDIADNHDDVSPKEKDTLTLERARKAWRLLQEWFIVHPPSQERVTQSIFILNMEMMNPSGPLTLTMNNANTSSTSAASSESILTTAFASSSTPSQASISIIPTVTFDPLTSTSTPVVSVPTLVTQSPIAEPTSALVASSATNDSITSFTNSANASVNASANASVPKTKRISNAPKKRNLLAAQGLF